MGVNTLRELDNMAVDAAIDQQLLSRFIQQNEFYIIKCASTVTHRYITKSDDEWSIALQAFTQAVQKYELNRGSFYSFSELLIRRRLIDYSRSQGKYNLEISVDPIVFDTDVIEDEEDISIHLAVAEQVSQVDSNTIKLEIQTANEAFSNYGFSFFDLTNCSPQAKKTKSSCAKAVAYLFHNPLLITQLHNSKQLPLKIIEKNVKVPRKILERHRKYIIAAVVILSGDYPNLADYLRHIREEIDK